MKPTRILAALSASIALTTPLMASDSSDRPSPPSRSLLYKTLDTDDDGTLSTGEIDGSTISLRTLDADSDGKLNRKELMPPRPAAEEDKSEDSASTVNDTQQQEQESHPRPPHPRPSPLMIVLDSDHDGELSSDELESAPQSLRTLDENGDGEINLDDLRPAPPVDAASSGGRPPGPPPHGRRLHPPGEESQDQENTQEPAPEAP